jgi:hypothetical protein
MGEKLKQIKTQQDESLERIRQAYRSQLANALSRVGQFTQVSCWKIHFNF